MACYLIIRKHDNSIVSGYLTSDAAEATRLVLLKELGVPRDYYYTKIIKLY